MRSFLRRQFVRHVGATLVRQVIALAFALGHSAIVARWLGREGKGALTLALMLPGALGLFLSGGVGLANVYFAGSRRFPVSILTANSVGFAILASALSGVIVGVLAASGWLEKLMPGVPLWLALLAMVSLPLGLFSGYFTAILQGLRRILAVNGVNLILGALTLALTVALVVVFPLGLFGGLMASLVAGGVGLLLSGLLLRREGGIFRPRWDRSVMYPTLSFALRAHIGSVLQFFNYRLDVFVVNYFLGPAEVGIYSVSVGIAELLWYLPNAVGFVIFPKAAATKPEAMNLFTPRVFRITLGLTALGGVGLALFAKPLIAFVYSSVFIGAYPPMLALLPGVVLLGSGKVLTNEIAGRGFPHYNSINAGVALVLTVVLDVLLIPRYGIMGAAIASTISYSAIFVTAVIFYRLVSRRPTEQTAPSEGHMAQGNF